MSTSPPRHSVKGDSTTIGGSTTRPPGLAAGHRGATLIDLSARLSARDITIAVLLDAHRVLTTDQIAEVLFDSTRTCLNRLRQLRNLDFVARFRPITADRRAPWHWTPGTLSARFVALAHEERPPTPKYLAQRQDAAMVSPQLAHTVGANGFFTRLLAHSRQHPSTRLARWWSPMTTAAEFHRRIYPDGHGVWRTDRGDVGFFLEHDNGTENHTRLIAKLDAYRRLQADGGPNHPVLFWLPSERREAHFHHRLQAADLGRGVTVATASWQHAGRDGSAGAVWLMPGGGPERLTLADLPSSYGDPGPYAPGPPGTHEDPLHLLMPLNADGDATNKI